MPVVDTTQSFNTGDTVTSTSLNNIMDQSVFVSGAVVPEDGLTITAGGQMTIENLKVTGAKIANQGVGTSQLADLNVTTAKIADLNVTTAKIANSNVTTAKIADANVTQAKLASNVVGNGPAFRAYASTATTVSTGVFTKVNLASEDFDSNSNFVNSRFTPSVAGYYLIYGLISYNTVADGTLAVIRKNGAFDSYGSPQVNDSFRSNVSDLLYFNGSTDYVELFAYHASGVNESISANSAQTYFYGCLIRSA